MAADAAGNDLEAVAVPRTGFVAVNWSATAPVAAADLKNELPTGYEFLGLITQDGGYVEENETGDRIEFFQQGYSKGGGAGALTATVTFAESSEAVRQLAGYDAGTTGVRKNLAYPDEFGLYVVIEDTDGDVFIRSGVATVTEATDSQATRGEVLGHETGFSWKWFSDTGFYRFAALAAPAGN